VASYAFVAADRRSASVAGVLDKSRGPLWAILSDTNLRSDAILALISTSGTKAPGLWWEPTPTYTGGLSTINLLAAPARSGVALPRRADFHIWIFIHIAARRVRQPARSTIRNSALAILRAVSRERVKRTVLVPDDDQLLTQSRSRSSST